MSLLRCTGRVVKVESKSGNKDGRDWSMTIYRVLVADQDIAELTAFADSAHTFAVGDDIDVAIQVDVRNGRQSISIDQPWELLVPESPAPSSTRKARAA